MVILGTLLASDNSVASLHRLLNSYHGGLRGSVSPDCLGHRRGLSERGQSGWVGSRRGWLCKRYVLRSNE